MYFIACQAFLTILDCHSRPAESDPKAKDVENEKGYAREVTISSLQMKLQGE
jgi:hypothetical protein